MSKNQSKGSKTLSNVKIGFLMFDWAPKLNWLTLKKIFEQSPPPLSGNNPKSTSEILDRPVIFLDHPLSKI